MKRKLAPSIVAALLYLGTAAAEEAPPRRVTLPEALDLLEQQNPDVLAARLEIASAAAEAVTARLFQNPTLSVDFNDFPIGRTTPPGLSVGETIGATARIDQPLSLWGKRGLRIKSAAAGVAVATDKARDALRELRSAVKGAFFQGLHDERLVEFTASNQARYAKVIDLNQRRFRAGDISEAELRKIQLENLKFLSESEEARKSLLGSRQLLGRLLGFGERTGAEGTLAAAGDVDVARLDLVNVALANRPDYAALEHARERAELDLRRAKRERLPDVTVGADYTNSQFVIAGNNRNTIGFGFSVPLPVFDRSQGEIAKAEVAMEHAETDLRRGRLDIEREVHDGVEAYNSALRLRRNYESGYLDHARTTLGAAEASYRRGAVSLIELLDAEREYTETETTYLNATLASRSTLAALEAALGKDLAGD